MKNIICAECPRGCEVTLHSDGKTTGNFCLKGAEYAKSELSDPKRIVTTTVRLLSGERLPVKTDKSIDKKRIFEIMARIKTINVEKPVMIGDVLAQNIDGCGVNIVATKSIK